ncbi:MAG: hypothetical protein O3B43_04395 [Chloroflexi bacterium]|nr:hypothetical protein [Chloroflexota bacterium]
MDAAVVVVVDVPVDRLDHFANRIEAVEIPQLLLETPVERLHETVLPGRCDVADRDPHAMLFEVVRAALSHELGTLVGVEDRRPAASGKRLVQGRENQLTIMPLANPRSDNLAGDKVLDRCQIPDRPPVAQAAQIRAPHLMRVANRPFVQQVAIAVMGRRDGAVVADPATGRSQAKLGHHPLSAFAIDAQVQGDPPMSVSGMLPMQRFDLLLKGLIFGGLLPGAVDVLAVDAQGLGASRLDPSPAD